MPSLTSVPERLELIARRRPRKREIILAWVAIGTLLAVAFGMTEGESVNAAQAMSAEQRQFIAERIALHYSGTLAGCMSGGVIVWDDPWTGAKMGTFCDTQVLSK